MFASLASARRDLDVIAGNFDPSSLSPQAALRVVDEIGSIRRAVDGIAAQAAKRVAAVGSSERDAVALMARLLGTSSGEVRAAIETATQLEKLPVTDAAVHAGQLSAREARLIAAAASVNPAAEQDLLDAAGRGLVPLRDACIAARAQVEAPDERGRRQHSERRARIRSEADGMVSLYARFTPEIGAQMKAKLDAEVQRIFRSRRTAEEQEPLEAYMADAVARFVLAEAGDGPAKGLTTTVHIVVDHGALMRGGAVDDEVCEIPGVGPVSVAWVKDLLGTAFLTVVIKKGVDIRTVAHLGRHVPAVVQTALVVSGRECDIEGCNHRGYLERDHADDYAYGGQTSFENLGWLCYAHHRLKSAGWHLGPRDAETRKRTLRQPERVP